MVIDVRMEARARADVLQAVVSKGWRHWPTHITGLALDYNVRGLCRCAELKEAQKRPCTGLPPMHVFVPREIIHVPVLFTYSNKSNGNDRWPKSPLPPWAILMNVFCIVGVIWISLQFEDTRIERRHEIA